MSPSVDPQAFPGLAFHGIIPVNMKIKDILLHRDNHNKTFGVKLLSLSAIEVMSMGTFHTLNQPLTSQHSLCNV